MSDVVVVDRARIVEQIAGVFALHTTVSKGACERLAELCMHKLPTADSTACTDALVAVECGSRDGLFDDEQHRRLAPLVHALRKARDG